MTETAELLDSDDTTHDHDRGPREAMLARLRAGAFPVVPPELATAVDVLRRAVELEHEVMSAPPEESLGQFCRRVADDLLVGRPYPKDFAARAILASQAADRAAAVSLAAATVRTGLMDRFPAIVTAALPGLLAGLGAELDGLMSELRTADEAIGDLNGTDPEAVAAATGAQRAAFLALGGLRRRYNTVRLAQRTALLASSVTVPGRTPWTVDADHGWGRVVFAVGVHEFSDVRGFGSLPGDVRSVEQLRALVAREDVWMPSVEELTAAWHELHDTADAA